MFRNYVVSSLNSSYINWSLSLQLVEYNSQQRKCRKIFLEGIFLSFQASAQTFDHNFTW